MPRLARGRMMIRMSAGELAKLDAIAKLAKLDHSKMVRRLVGLAYADMVKCWPDLAVDLAPSRAPGSISTEIPPEGRQEG